MGFSWVFALHALFFPPFFDFRRVYAAAFPPVSTVLFAANPM
jgi:hypothetical protein